MFIKENPDTGKNYLNTEYFNTNEETITDSSDLNELVTEMLNYLIESADQFQKEYGCSVVWVECFDIYIEFLEKWIFLDLDKFK